MGELSNKEFRKKNKLTDKELKILIRHINKNMKMYDKDIEGRMKQSDRREMEINRVRPDIDEEKINF